MIDKFYAADSAAFFGYHRIGGQRAVFFGYCYRYGIYRRIVNPAFQPAGSLCHPIDVAPRLCISDFAGMQLSSACQRQHEKTAVCPLRHGRIVLGCNAEGKALGRRIFSHDRFQN